MARVLSISSQVIRGHVGNSAVVPALRSLGHEVWPVPTVILSNHPGHGATAGMALDAETIDSMINRLDDFGWLQALDAVFTGYFRTEAQVRVTARHIEAVKQKRPSLRLFVDPVLGDEPKGVYVPEAVAIAIRDHLVPLADVIAPNHFELGWLAGTPITDLSQARQAVFSLGLKQAVVTSFPLHREKISNLLVTPALILSADVDRRLKVPHGTGDLLSGLILGHLLAGRTLEESLGRAVAGVEATIIATGDADELALTSLLPSLATCPALPLKEA